MLDKESKYLFERVEKAKEGKKMKKNKIEKEVSQEFFNSLDKVNNIYAMSLQQEYLKAFLFDE